MGVAARFFAVDLHVHTPGSADAKPEAFGTPDDVVAAAIAAGLDAVAITDHNTASWCDDVATAAASTPLVVLPGIEISTTEGHLLAVWEEGTSSDVLNDLLAQLNIGHADRGKLDVATDVGLADAAKKVAAAGGLAIAAHADKNKGLLSMPVRAHLDRTLLEPALSAVEVVQLDAIPAVQARVDGKRTLACIRGSDTWDASGTCHALSGIGLRRTWIKASRPDLVGLNHAVQDPDLRVRLEPPDASPAYTRVDRIEFQGGFLGGEVLEFCPDLNCLLGGTGAGKSLVLEAIRYALHQQLNREKFPKLWDEVESRLVVALGENGVVRLELNVGGSAYRVERTFRSGSPDGATVQQRVQGEWVAIDVQSSDLVTLAAFSQGEILEYSREPVGRMSLIDTGIDLADINATIVDVTARLNANARDLIAARARVARLEAACAEESAIQEQVRELSQLFDSELVKQQGKWQTEGTQLKAVVDALGTLAASPLSVPKLGTPQVEGNQDLFSTANEMLQRTEVAVTDHVREINAALSAARSRLEELHAQWAARHTAFKQQLDDQLQAVEQGTTLVALRSRLESLQSRAAQIAVARDELSAEARPALQQLAVSREQSIQALQDARHARRELRRARVETLNQKTAGIVKLDVPSQGDFAEFRQALELLKVGSHVREPVLDAIARTVHPLKFARALWDGDVNQLVNVEEAIDATSIARLMSNIADRNLEEQLLATQVIDRPDVLTVKFKKPEDGVYASIEQLAHGQRCTAILVILLADGDTPVLVDQPEDALHAPWIEDYLVDRLRSLRGTRQYIFATRSPGIVVSGDAEQIITMKASAGHGEVEATGSLERHELNRLTLHHLEGGPIPFNRRWRKLAKSVAD